MVLRPLVVGPAVVKGGTKPRSLSGDGKIANGVGEEPETGLAQLRVLERVLDLLGVECEETIGFNFGWQVGSHGFFKYRQIG